MPVNVINKASAYMEASKQEAKVNEVVQQIQPVLTEIPKISKTSTELDTDIKENLEQEKSQNDQKHIENIIKEANNKMKHSRTKCEFSYHEPTKRVTIKVLDKETDEVLIEVPPEETLKMVEKLRELAGIMVDEKR